jgi:hypothetical protein
MFLEYNRNGITDHSGLFVPGVLLSGKDFLMPGEFLFLGVNQVQRYSFISMEDIL